MKSSFEATLQQDAQQIEAFLREWVDGLSARTPPAPQRLINAVRHGILGGGKRMRPFLVMEVARMLGAGGAQVLKAAAAIELVHCYSLVHDDLPCMDNDLMRRGQPTVHIAYDEATALLAGNVMLTHAFEILLNTKRTQLPPCGGAVMQAQRSVTEGDENSNLGAIPPSASLHSAAPPQGGSLIERHLLHTLISGAGLNGMLGGQQWDLTAEGRFADTSEDMHTEDAITRLQSMKTGALILAAVKMGAILGGANDAQMHALEAYAQNLGLAFQISDDLLDVMGDIAQVGKATGKDQAAGKSTFVSLLGVEGAQARLAKCIAEGEVALNSLNLPCDALRGALQAMAGRGK